ncbi:MAG: heme-binding protein [Actinomycetota bacterium]|nr:heme-binding protein [Mycobacterium lentiflavum]MEE3064272.1 heme-binding protein [Actinomycetota bacterium]ULP43089.2 heme-binding protein [Mycobacterium lentiflavum]
MIAGCVLGVGIAPTAVASPDPCSASGVAATASGVLNSASGYLDGHPDANNVLTAAVNQSPADAKASVRGYFLSHPGEALELKGIAQPLLDLRSRCNTSVSPDQLAALFNALSN